MPELSVDAARLPASLADAAFDTTPPRNHDRKRYMHRILANASRLLSRLAGGAPNTTLCRRAAMRWGWDCLFCRVFAAVLRDRDHCLDELSAAEIVALKQRRKK